MGQDNQEGTAVLMDTIISGFSASQKETDLPNNEGDVCMKTITPEIDAMKSVHSKSCVTDNLISVPVDYVPEVLKQCTNTKQAHEAACEIHETQVGHTWKRKTRNLTSSASVSSEVSIAVGSKRNYKDTVSTKDENLVEGWCKSSKRGRLVGDNHDNFFPTAEADEQPRRAQ